MREAGGVVWDIESANFSVLSGRVLACNDAAMATRVSTLLRQAREEANDTGAGQKQLAAL